MAKTEKRSGVVCVECDGLITAQTKWTRCAFCLEVVHKSCEEAHVSKCERPSQKGSEDVAKRKTAAGRESLNWNRRPKREAAHADGMAAAGDRPAKTRGRKRKSEQSPLAREIAMATSGGDGSGDSAGQVAEAKRSTGGFTVEDAEIIRKLRRKIVAQAVLLIAQAVLLIQKRQQLKELEQAPELIEAREAVKQVRAGIGKLQAELDAELDDVSAGDNLFTDGARGDKAASAIDASSTSRGRSDA